MRTNRLSVALGQRGVLTIVAASCAMTMAMVAIEQSEAELERQGRVPDLLRLLDARPGAVIADVGAGDGFYTVRIARAVAPTGRAVAVDVAESALNKLRERVTRDHVADVDIVLGAADDPHLGDGRLDAVLIHNAYHEMTAYEAMLRRIHSALKPGGRFVIVEPLHDTSRGLPREQQVANHDIERGIVESELRSAAFEIVEHDDEFIKFTGVPGGFWLIVARRP
jgi:ubiquinone/menaquinone biosynthesis C-methylase UbiE